MIILDNRNVRKFDRIGMGIRVDGTENRQILDSLKQIMLGIMNFVLPCSFTSSQIVILR